MPVTDPFTTRCTHQGWVFCSRWAWQMAGLKFGVQMMDSEYCSKRGERLQDCNTAAWRIGGADLPVSQTLFPLFCLPKQSNRSWFQIAIVILKSGSDLRKSWVWSRLESQPASSITEAEIAGSGAKPFLSCFSNAFRIQLWADADYNHYLAPQLRSAESNLSASWICRHVHKHLIRFKIRADSHSLIITNNNESFLMI